MKSFIYEYTDTLSKLDKKEQKNWIKINNLSGDEWCIIGKIVEVFESTYILTKQLQKTKCTLSDFYGSWLRMEMAINRCLTTPLYVDGEVFDLPRKMIEALNSYRDRLLNNPMLLAAVFLDPRFSNYLKAPLKTLAIGKLLKLYEEIRKREINVNDLEEDDLDCYLASQNCDNNPSGSSKLHALLEQFTQQTPEKSKIDVLEYWNQNKTAKPELYLLSRVVFCVAPTQAATERSNSCLSFVFSKYRGNLGQNVLEDILVIRPNADLFDLIVAERLNKFL